MSSNLLELETATEFQATEAYSSFDQTKSKYISRLSEVEKENVIVQINPNSSSHVKKENRHDDENKVYNQYVHLDSQYNLFAI
jgi:hypothetical protein